MKLVVIGLKGLRKGIQITSVQILRKCEMYKFCSLLAKLQKKSIFSDMSINEGYGDTNYKKWIHLVKSNFPHCIHCGKAIED